MKVLAVIEADLETTPLGTKSRCAQELGGVPILRRTVERLERCQHLAAIHVLCPTGQIERCRRLMGDVAATVTGQEANPAPWRGLVQAARKWSLDGWRGGIGGTTTFDEYTDPRVLNGLLKTVEADAVLSIPPAAPVVDPGIADRMIQHWRADEDDARLIVTQSPPGLAGILLDRKLVEELSERGIPVGWLISYKPDAPQKDVIFTSCNCPVPAEVRFAVGRLIADTERSTRTLVDLLRDHPEPDAVTIGRWLVERERTHLDPVPREVELELTTDDPYPHSLLRPRGELVPHRGPLSVETAQRVGEDLGRFDDSLIVLGGFGEPMRHPQLREILNAFRSKGDGRGVYGIAVRTLAFDLDDERIEMLLESRVDVVEVMLDAWTPNLYAKLHAGSDQETANLERVLGRMNRLTELREQRGHARPILVPSMTKCKENVHEMDEFHDGWLRRAGAVAIHGYSHRAGQMENRSVAKMTPPSRGSCRRLRTRCMVLADGSVTLCDQDFKGLKVLGHLERDSLESIWRGQEFERVQRGHDSGEFNVAPLCAACEEWDRP